MAQLRLATSTALVALFGAAMAQAQVTPEQVWQNWQKLSASYGQALVADSVTRQGDTLVVKGVKTSMAQDGATMTGALDEVRFRDLGDGTVEATASESYVMQVVMPAEDGTADSLNITLSQPGMRVIAAGNGPETSYTYDLPNMSLAIQALENGVALADITAKAAGLTALYRFTTAADVIKADLTMDMQTLGFAVSAQDKADTFELTGNIAALKLASGGTFLGIEAMENLPKALRDGMSFTTALSYGAGSFDINGTESGVPTTVLATNESGRFDFALNGETLRYGLGGTGMNLTLSGGDIPFPQVKVSYGEAAFDMMIPVAKTAVPVDFSLLTRIVDLAVSDEIWGMMDPTGTLPRDPATLIVDAKGKVQLTTDLFDEAAMEALGEAAPGDLHALTLTEITAKAAGAALTGMGDFTFNNNDLTTFDGIPAPTGKIELTLSGGNGLLDKLVAMGLIPSEEAMGMRMMLAMLAKPGENPDVLTSVLEFKDKGFYANGQRLQ